MNYKHSNRNKGWIEQYIGLKNHDKGKYWKKPWNVITGCTKVSEGCENCWAKDINDRFKQGDFSEVKFHEDKLYKTLKWDTSLIFTCNTSDLFHQSIDTEKISSVLYVPTWIHNWHHVFLILTKRPERLGEFYSRLSGHNNIILGTSIENQKWADIRIPELLKVPAWKRVLSIEPLLGKIMLAQSYIDKARFFEMGTLDWVIIGSESGPNRRPCKIEWIESIVEQCRAAGVPVFVKQIHDSKGKVIHDIDQFPESVRYREYWQEDITNE